MKGESARAFDAELGRRLGVRMGCTWAKVVEELTLVIENGFTNRAHKLIRHDTSPFTIPTRSPNLPRDDDRKARGGASHAAGRTRREQTPRLHVATSVEQSHQMFGEVIYVLNSRGEPKDTVTSPRSITS